jgi:hypothetical protein
MNAQGKDSWGHDAYMNFDAEGHARSDNDRRAPVERRSLMQIAAIQFSAFRWQQPESLKIALLEYLK